jgi:hypothetical protein
MTSLQPGSYLSQHASTPQEEDEGTHRQEDYQQQNSTEALTWRLQLKRQKRNKLLK